MNELIGNALSIASSALVAYAYVTHWKRTNESLGAKKPAPGAPYGLMVTPAFWLAAIAYHQATGDAFAALPIYALAVLRTITLGFVLVVGRWTGPGVLGFLTLAMTCYALRLWLLNGPVGASVVLAGLICSLTIITSFGLIALFPGRITPKPWKAGTAAFALMIVAVFMTLPRESMRYGHSVMLVPVIMTATYYVIANKAASAWPRAMMR